MNLENLVGQTLDGKYKIERELGRGGMGAVYLSTHVGTDRPVAVKVIVPQFMQRSEFVERFRREARAAGRLRHPNVVDVTDFGFADTQNGRVAYLVMEYLDGCTLGEILEEEKQLPLEWTLDILEQVSSAVGTAHEQGIIHRDLKPDNIWLEPNQRGGYTVKVLDFGIAKLEAEPLKNYLHENSESALSLSPNQTIGVRQNTTVADENQSRTISENPGATRLGEGETIAKPPDSEISLAEAGTLIQPVEKIDSESETAILPQAQTRTIKQESEAGTKLISEQIETEDFELKKVSTSELTRVGAVLGTPLYMSPEQCRGEKLDARSDIYSLAVIAYQMLSGKMPFVGNFTEVMQSHKETAPPPLEAKKIPKKVKRAIMSALSKNAEARPQTAQGFVSRLHAQSEGIGVLLQRALVIYSQHLPKFLMLALLIYLPITLITIAQVTVNFLDVSGAMSDAGGMFVKVFLGISSFVLSIFCAYLILGTTTWMVTQILGAPLRPVTLRPALKIVKTKWKALAGTGVLSTILTFVGYALCFIPGLVLSVIWALVAPVVIMENLRGRAALKRSKILVMHSLRTTVAAVFIMFIVPALIASLITLFVATTVKSFEADSNTDTAVVKQTIKTDDENKQPSISVTADSKDDVKINIGRDTIKINNKDDSKDFGKSLRVAVRESLSQILLLPLTIFMSSFSAIIVALLYLKSRQAGGESMSDLLAQFEEVDRPRSNWQRRIRKHLIQSGKIISKG